MAHRVVVVGGGFGGLTVAKALADAPVEVTLVDRRNHHVFQPLLYQVATAGLNPSDIAYPIRAIVGSQANARVLLGEVVDVHPASSEVELENGSRIAFDHLVLAAGAGQAYFGHDEWEIDAPGLKSIEDATEIRRRVLTAFETAERAERSGDHDSGALTFVVVGGGPTGVEMAGAIAEIATKTLPRDFRVIDPSAARVILIEGLDRVLNTFHPTLSLRAEHQLRDLGVEVMTDTEVTHVDARGVEVAGPEGTKRIAARTIVWGAGVAASPLADTLDVELDRAGRVPVASDLSVPGHRNIFAIGDMASATSNGDAVPGVAPAAMQGAEHVARAIIADLNHRSRPTFRYKDKGSLATVGRSRAVAEFGRLRFSGVPAWVLWWAVHIAQLIGFRSRLTVLASWGWSWITFKRAARLITERWSPREPS